MFNLIHVTNSHCSTAENKTRIPTFHECLCMTGRSMRTRSDIAILLLIVSLGAYVRFAKLTSVGLLDGDDFFYFKWAYNWFVGDYKLFGLYRIANPIIGNLALLTFGINDYSFHLFVAAIGVVNILLSYVLSMSMTKMRIVSLSVAFIHSLSLRVVEVDRTLIPYTITEFFFITSCIFFIIFLRYCVTNAVHKSRTFSLSFLSGMFLSFAAHSHWDVACQAVTMICFIFIFIHFATNQSAVFILIAALLFAFGFWIPILIGMLTFSPVVVISGIFSAKSTLAGMALQKTFSTISLLASILSLYKVIVAKNTGSYLLGIMFIVSVCWVILIHTKFGKFSLIYAKRSEKIIILFPMFLVAVYFFTIKILNMDTFLQHWHAQYLTPFVLSVTFFLLYDLLRSTRFKPQHRDIVFCVLVLSVFVQCQPLEPFTNRLHSPTPYRAMGDTLAHRASFSDRVLITPYVVLDFRYQTLTPPSYLTKEYVDHIFEYSDDLPFDRQIAKNGIRYLVISTELVNKQSSVQIGVRANIGRAYGLTSETYSLSKELLLLRAYVDKVQAIPLYISNGTQIYDLRPGT